MYMYMYMYMYIYIYIFIHEYEAGPAPDAALNALRAKLRKVRSRESWPPRAHQEAGYQPEPTLYLKGPYGL